MQNDDPLPRLLDRPIVLVGLMGVGKSTVGRRLATRLGLDFVDSDDAIGEAAGAPAGEVLEKFGEAAFRDGERRVIARLIDGQVRVIATGGGAFVDPGTRTLLKERTITVWLRAPTELLHQRTARRPTRPLLKTVDPQATLARLAAERDPFYAEAMLHIVSTDGAPSMVVDAIIAKLVELQTAAAGKPPAA